MRGSEVCAIKKQNNASPLPIKSPNSPLHSYDVLNYNLDLDIFHCFATPYPKNFTGKNIITFRVDSTLSSINLDADNTSIQILSVGGNGISFTHNNDVLNIILNRVYNPGETAQVSVHYNHLNVIDGAFNVANGFVFTDAEPEGARKWFPCYDSPSDKATVQLRAKVPVNVKLGSNGRLADSTIIADSLWYTWNSKDPVATYLTVLTAKTNYKLDIYNWVNPNDPLDTFPIRFYYNQNENPDPMINIIGPLTNLYVDKFGEHPFEKNGFATVNNLFQWGGMENQTLTTLCPGCWSSSLIAHEYAHQWFGDMITCATWSDLWLNEGFATFVEALWTEEVEGYQAYVNELEGNANYYMWSNPGWPISDPEWAINPPSNDVLFNYAITYMKGSCVLYMYRHLVGDSLFFSSIYDYANDTVNFRYKSATIPDFITKMNESTGMDLNWFFEEWLYTPDHPTYYSVYEIVQKPANQWEIKLNINQTQTTTGFFKMPIDIQVIFANGQGDTIVSVMNDVNNQFFSLTFNKRPLSIIFDPDNKILLKESTLVVGTDSHTIPSTADMNIIKNPVSNNLLINYSTPLPELVNIQIISPEGKLLINKNNVKANIGENIFTVPVNTLKNGVYIVRTNSGSHQLTRKVIISQ